MMEFIESQKGSKKLVLNGFMYTVRRTIWSLLINRHTHIRISVHVVFLCKMWVALKRADCCGDQRIRRVVYLDDVYLVTALVPSLTACLANSPGSSRRTAVWITRLVIVERLL